LSFCGITSSYFMKYTEHRLNFCLPLFRATGPSDPVP
jgi:hypothetical protein